MGAGKAHSTAEYAKVAQRNSAVEGGAQTLSPSTPAIYFGNGVLWAMAKSSTTWLVGCSAEGLETHMHAHPDIFDPVQSWLRYHISAYLERSGDHRRL